MKKKLHIEGMTCAHCEKKITEALYQNSGIIDVKAKASKNLVHLEYDDSVINLEKMISDIERVGYFVSPVRVDSKRTNLLIFMVLTVLGFLVLKYGNSISFDFLPNIRQHMGYGALFIVGLLTSVHCIAMCGGINISQCNKYRGTGTFEPSLLYNLGRITSYTIIGGVIGGVGSVLSFSGQARGYVTLFVSFIMVLMAIRMLKLFDLPLPKLKLSKSLQKALYKISRKGPFFVGLANGFMPCGPLQSMQLYALGTGSIVRGALSMFYFSLGTFPLMFSLGFISSLLNHKFSKNIMKYSGILIFVLGLTMFSRGAALAGILLPFQYNGDQVLSTFINKDLQEVRIDLTANNYAPIQVIKDIPVKFIIYADTDTINGCNNPITIPSLGTEYTLVPGENVIYFTPKETGKMAYTCWMGMITSYIEVVEE